LIQKKKAFKLFIIFTLFVFMNNCTNQEKAPGPPYTAEVLQMNSMSSTQKRSEAPTFKFDKATFTWLQDLNSLNGNYFNFVFGGILKASYVSGSIVAAKNFEQSKDLNLRYQVKNGVVVPKDYSTLAMLSSYYQFDVVANNIQTMTGYSIDTIFSKYGKIRIFFEPKIILETDGSTIQSSGKLNAAYVPGAHQFIMFQRSNLENIPLAANLQVIAHDFGHSIWELNEGFADMNSYTLTGSTNILQNSIDFGNGGTQRNFSTITFTYNDIAGGVADTSNSMCEQSFYCIGTLFANALFNAQKNLGYDQTSLSGSLARGTFMTLVTNALKTTKSNMSNLPSSNFSDYCKPSSGDSNNSLYNGLILGSFFNSFLTQIGSGATQTQICTQLKANFGSVGFPSTYRVGCT
jgi:hypothetical protein